MLCVYGHKKYCYSQSVRIDFRRQILTSKIDPRAVRVKWLCRDIGLVQVKRAKRPLTGNLGKDK